MHMNTKRILPWLTAALLMASACSIDNVRETDGSRNDGDYVDVCLSVQPQGELRTRATYGKDGDNIISYVPSISQGNYVDMLIYAVYEVNRNEDKIEYKRLVQYGLGDLTGYGSEDDHKPAVGEGQTILRPAFSEGKTNEKEKITLRLMRGREYAVAFWAQNHETSAFDTRDLENVVVYYENAQNNDELRDAFCKVEIFIVSPDNGLLREVVLQRPFAQINVGTTGADYYNHLSFANQGYKPDDPVKKSVLYSSITLEGVSNCIDVVADKISCTEDFKGKAEFAPAKIAAYWEVDKDIEKLSLHELIGSDTEPDPETDPDSQAYIFPTFVDKEEFLMINLDDHGDSDKTYNKAHTTGANAAGYLKYKTEYPTIDEKGGYLTETFKYISMCYVLVPAVPSETDSDPYSGAVLNSVSFKMGDNADLDRNPEEGRWCNKEITLTSVPVHRNWRTNILGGLYGKGTNYPDEGDDDPSSLFETFDIQATIYVGPAYDGDYNRNKPGSGQEWSEQKKNASTETK